MKHLLIGLLVLSLVGCGETRPRKKRGGDDEPQVVKPERKKVKSDDAFDPVKCAKQLAHQAEKYGPKNPAIISSAIINTALAEIATDGAEEASFVEAVRGKIDELNRGTRDLNEQEIAILKEWSND